MEEPSVLDYLKAKLMPWRGPAPEIPPLPEEGKSAVVAPQKKAKDEGSVAEETAGLSLQLATFPWRPATAFGLLLLAQFFWAPERGQWPLGLLLGGLAIGLVLVGVQKGEWRLPVQGEIKKDDGELPFRGIPLFLTLIFFVLAFSTSGGNEFTGFNVLLWLLTVGMAFAAFLPRESLQNALETIKGKSIKIEISRWHFLLPLSFLLAFFFRFYRLGNVPIEMISDHAEKLLDVGDVLNGERPIFFERNTGREPLQFYLTAAIATWFKTGLSYISLKLGTSLIGFLSLIYVYLLGKDFGGRWVGLLAVLLMGMAYWPNVLARTGLRFVLYPSFVAPVLFHLIRGLRGGKASQFLLSGLFLGIGLYGYTAFRVVPLIAVVAVVLFLFHNKDRGVRKQRAVMFIVLALMAFLVFTPLMRYALESDSYFNFRVLSRVTEVESVLPGPAWQIFLNNLWGALIMPIYSAGNIWLVGLVHRPALDLLSGALFVIGVALVIWRYSKERNWQDLFWLVSIPMLMLPSIMALAFPGENPAMNRAGGAVVPIMLMAAFALDAFVHGIKDKLGKGIGLQSAIVLGAILMMLIGAGNYDLLFRQYAGEFANYSWNSSELGEVIVDFNAEGSSVNNAWVVSFPHWLDTRLVAINAGYPARDFGIWPEQLDSTLDVVGPKLFLLNLRDGEGLDRLQTLYPNFQSSVVESTRQGKEFVRFYVP